MDIYSLLLIALALSLDAFGVAISIGLNKCIKLSNKVLFSISFGFFQFLFAFIGAFAGFLFNTYVVSVPKLVGGAVILIVGILMIREGLQDKEDNILLNSKMYIILGASVSIDAMVIGFTALNNITSNIEILKYTVFIGIVTLVISSIGFFIAKFLKEIEIVSKYADYIGGIILVIFGIKMMFF